MIARLWIAGLALTLMGCGAEAGSSCTLDSDCDAGLICGLDGVCATAETVAHSLKKANSEACAKDDQCQSGLCRDGRCRPIDSCPPTRTHTVTSVRLHDEGHGAAGLATLANSTIAEGIEDGSIKLELAVFSEIGTTCDDTCAWVTDTETVDSTCTFPFGTAFPVPVSFLKGPVLVNGFTYDLETGLLEGLLDPKQLASVLADELLDVDTDDDGENDHASAKLTVELAD